MFKVFFSHIFLKSRIRKHNYNKDSKQFVHKSEFSDNILFGNFTLFTKTPQNLEQKVIGLHRIILSEEKMPSNP